MERDLIMRWGIRKCRRAEVQLVHLRRGHRAQRMVLRPRARHSGQRRWAHLECRPVMSQQHKTNIGATTQRTKT